MSFILDALRKSEHERQRGAVPGLAQVPLATPAPPLPRWALAVMAGLAAAVLALAGAWWQSNRDIAEVAATLPVAEQHVALPPTPPERSDTGAARVARPSVAEPVEAQREPSVTAAASSSLAAEASRANDPPPVEPGRITIVELGNRPIDGPVTGAPLDLPTDAPALPSAAALAAEGVSLPPLRLELHAFSAEPRNRFVFINGRKYVEGERLVEGPQLVEIEPAGAVLVQSGRRFLLRQE